MTPDQIQLIRETFALVAPRADVAALLFYKRLFELDPALRPLFRPDIEEQGRKLMQMLGAAVRLLDAPRSLVPVLEDLGRRHVGYGVRDQHYEVMTRALLETFKEILGESFTREVEEVWRQALDFVTLTMKRCAAQHRSAAGSIG